MPAIDCQVPRVPEHATIAEARLPQTLNTQRACRRRPVLLAPFLCGAHAHASPDHARRRDTEARAQSASQRNAGRDANPRELKGLSHKCEHQHSRHANPHPASHAWPVVKPFAWSPMQVARMDEAWECQQGKWVKDERRRGELRLFIMRPLRYAVPNRVNQLEAAALDSELIDMLLDQVCGQL